MTTQNVEIKEITLRLQGNKVISPHRTFNGTIAINRTGGAVFVEESPSSKRTPKPMRLYDGKFVTATCSSKGECRLNLRSIDINACDARTHLDVAVEIKSAINAIKILNDENRPI